MVQSPGHGYPRKRSRDQWSPEVEESVGAELVIGSESWGCPGEGSRPWLWIVGDGPAKLVGKVRTMAGGSAPLVGPRGSPGRTDLVSPVSGTSPCRRAPVGHRGSSPVNAGGLALIRYLPKGRRQSRRRTLPVLGGSPSRFLGGSRALTLEHPRSIPRCGHVT